MTTRKCKCPHFLFNTPNQPDMWPAHHMHNHVISSTHQLIYSGNIHWSPLCFQPHYRQWAVEEMSERQTPALESSESVRWSSGRGKAKVTSLAAPCQGAWALSVGPLSHLKQDRSVMGSEWVTAHLKLYEKGLRGRKGWLVIWTWNDSSNPDDSWEGHSLVCGLIPHMWMCANSG